MRLGAYDAQLVRGGLALRTFMAPPGFQSVTATAGEVNMDYRKVLESNGLLFSGLSPDGELPEIVERTDHPWFIGVQFHPELKSRPFEPHPLFRSFVNAALVQSRLV